MADAQEVLAFVTSVLRGEPDDARMTDRLKAADMLGKRYRLFDEGSGEGAGVVTLVDDILAEADEEAPDEPLAEEAGERGREEAPASPRPRARRGPPKGGGGA